MSLAPHLLLQLRRLSYLLHNLLLLLNHRIIRPLHLPLLRTRHMPIRPRKDSPLGNLIIAFPILKQHRCIRRQVRRRVPHDLMERRPAIVEIAKIPLTLRLPHILVLLDGVQIDLLVDAA